MLKNVLLKIIKKNDFLYLVFLILSRRNDPFYRGLFRDIDKTSGRILYFQKFGELNPDKRIYITGFSNSMITFGGILAEIRRNLIELRIVDKFGLTPVIEYKNSLYSENILINNTYNAFEYYFKPLSNVTVDEAWKSQYVNVQRDSDSLYSDIEFGYNITNEQIQELGLLYQKYFVLNDDTEHKIMNDIHSLIQNKRTLGCHIRGTDFNQQYNGHPIAVGIEDYIPKIENLLKKKIYEQVFFATDDNRLLEKFRNYFGSNLIYYSDVIRSTNDEGVHVQSYIQNKAGVKYRAGFEVLRDVYTLVHCSGFIAGHSGVELMTRVIKSGTNNRFEDFILLSKGIYNNKNNYKQKNLRN